MNRTVASHRVLRVSLGHRISLLIFGFNRLGSAIPEGDVAHDAEVEDAHDQESDELRHENQHIDGLFRDDPSAERVGRADPVDRLEVGTSAQDGKKDGHSNGMCRGCVWCPEEEVEGDEEQECCDDDEEGPRGDSHVLVLGELAGRQVLGDGIGLFDGSDDTDDGGDDEDNVTDDMREDHVVLGRVFVMSIEPPIPVFSAPPLDKRIQARN